MSDTFQYRCYLYDPTKSREDRPVQAFFNHKENAEAWAKIMLERAGDNSEVWLYEITETLNGSWKRKI